MKIRQGFVSNSSSSSFVCILSVSGYDSLYCEAPVLERAFLGQFFEETEVLGQQGRTRGDTGRAAADHDVLLLRGSPNGENITTDIHGTKAEAEGVCNRLRDEGFGGERKIFPLKTWTEEIKE